MLTMAPYCAILTQLVCDVAPFLKITTDIVARAVESLRKLGGRSAHTSEWIEDQDVLFYRGKIYVPDVDDIRRKIVERHHDTKIGGHPGRFKTLELVSRTFWWPGVSRFVQRYVEACDLCLRTKPSRHAPFGVLRPTETPHQPWEAISVDFIVELPQSNGYDAILTVVDSLTKRVHFIPTFTTVDTSGLANLYLQHVWKLHGLPDKIVSDRGPQFVLRFTKELSRLLGIRLATSTAYHPQTDGQCKVTRLR